MNSDSVSNQTKCVWGRGVWKTICSPDSLFLWRVRVEHKLITIRSSSVGGNEGAGPFLVEAGKLSRWLTWLGQGHSANSQTASQFLAQLTIVLHAPVVSVQKQSLVGVGLHSRASGNVGVSSLVLQRL